VAIGCKDPQMWYWIPSEAKTIATPSLPHPEISDNRVLTIFGLASWLLKAVIGCKHPKMRYWLPEEGKTIGTHSPPHPENEHQRSVDNFWSCIFSNPSGDWLTPSINE